MRPPGARRARSCAQPTPAGAPFVLIVGDIEARRGFGLLKSMRGEGRQRQVSFERLDEILRGWDGDEPAT